MLLTEEIDLKKERNEEGLRSQSLDMYQNPHRVKLLEKIEIKLEEYAKLLSSAHILMKLNKPPERDFESMEHWFDEHAPLVAGERYTRHKEDLITLRTSRERAWLDWFLDEIVLKRSHKSSGGLLRWLFALREAGAKAGPEHKITFFRRTRLRKLVNLVRSFVLSLTGLALLVVPVYWLYKLSSRPDARSERAFGGIIGVLVLFTFLFSAVLSLFTRARRHEILAAAAAYCAVLVVFVGNVGQADNGSEPSANTTTPS